MRHIHTALLLLGLFYIPWSQANDLVEEQISDGSASYSTVSNLSNTPLQVTFSNGRSYLIAVNSGRVIPCQLIQGLTVFIGTPGERTGGVPLSSHVSCSYSYRVVE